MTETTTPDDGFVHAVQIASQELPYPTALKANPTSNVDFSQTAASVLVSPGGSPSECINRYRPLPDNASPLRASYLRFLSVIMSWLEEKPFLPSTLSDHVNFKCPATTTFKYEPLPNTEATIRILYLHPLSHSGKIEVSLTVVNLSDKPVYTALSYEWGTEIEQQVITVNGHFVHIHKNLYQLLLRLCPKHGFRRLWVDAICINQNNISERNSQVQMMGDIYKTATSVVAWLGDDAEHGEALLRHLKRSGEVSRTLLQYGGESVEQNPRLEVEPSADSASVEALKILLRRTYWSRAWILQELMHGREITLMCGDEDISWEYLRALCGCPLWSASFKNTVIDKLFFDKIALANGRHLVMHILMEEYPNRLCADPRDQIYSLLSIDSTYKEPKRLIDVDYNIDFQSLLFRTFNSSVDGRYPANFERLRLSLGISWADLLDVSKRRYTTVDEQYLEPQHPWAIYAELYMEGRVSDARTIKVGGHDLIAVSATFSGTYVLHSDGIATVAEIGDYIFGFKGSSLALVLRLADSRGDLVGKMIQKSFADALSEVEYQALTSGFSSFHEIAITATPTHAVARLDVKQWRTICACLKPEPLLNWGLSSV